MKKIVETVAEGGGEVGVHSYPHQMSLDYFSMSRLRSVTLEGGGGGGIFLIPLSRVESPASDPPST